MQGLAETEDRLQELVALLPEVGSKLGKMKADLLCALLRDTHV